jgi:hypothetical protein
VASPKSNPDGLQPAERELAEALTRVLRKESRPPDRSNCPAPAVLRQIATDPAGFACTPECEIPRRHVGRCLACSEDLARLRQELTRRDAAYYLKRLRQRFVLGLRLIFLKVRLPKNSA